LLINISQNSKITNLQEFLETFKDIKDIDIENGTLLNFDLKSSHDFNKAKPILRLARIDEADELRSLFEDSYKDTYPFKIMEDINEIIKMIKNPNYDWFLFKTQDEKTAGCFGATYDFEGKKAYLHGFVIKRSYQKSFNSFKAFIGALTYLWRKYKNRIFIWFGEMRTNNNTTQWCTNYCGMYPVAFFPNKDLFFKKPESEFLHVAYDSRALKELRTQKTPRIIRSVLNCYYYSNQRYNLGLPKVENEKISLNQAKLKNLREFLVIKKETDKFENSRITFQFKRRDSYFRFLYNRPNDEIEKCTYRIKSVEELNIFVARLNDFIEYNDVRYSEVFVSAYKPLDQKIFLNGGFKPTGYIPSWKFNKITKSFEDCIVFIVSKGNIKNVKTITESKKLLNVLKMQK
jgi:hypothetical protein